MKERRILDLLREAATCDDRRFNQIQSALGAEVYDVGTLNTPGLKLVLDALIVSARESCPKRLPNLYPVFALLCGDREDGKMVAEIDWLFPW